MTLRGPNSQPKRAKLIKHIDVCKQMQAFFWCVELVKKCRLFLTSTCGPICLSRTSTNTNTNSDSNTNPDSHSNTYTYTYTYTYTCSCARTCTCTCKCTC